MSEMVILVASGFLLGGLGVLLLLVVNIFKSNTLLVRVAIDECVRLEEKLEAKVNEFDEITRKASEANLSIGERVVANDKRLNDLENRIAMVKMQR